MNTIHILIVEDDPIIVIEQGKNALRNFWRNQ